MRFQTSLVFLFVSTACASDAFNPWTPIDPVTTPNVSFQRESRPDLRRAFILSSFSDLRHDAAGVSSAYIIPGFVGLLSLRVENHQEYYDSNSILARNPYDPIQFGIAPSNQEKRNDATLRWRQTWGGSSWATEAEMTGVRRRGNEVGNEYAYGDIHARFLWQFFQGRSTAITLVAGCAAPIGDKEDPTISHGSWTPELGLRLGYGFGRWAWNSDLLSSFTPVGSYLVDKDDSELPIRQITLTAGTMLSYRMSGWLRVGGAQRVEWQRIDPRGDGKDLFSATRWSRAPLTGFAEFTTPAAMGPFSGIYFTGEAGIDMTDRYLSASDRMTYTLSTTFVFN